MTYTERMERKDAWLARRAARRTAWAEKAEGRSNAAYEASNEAVRHIPEGQPILVGHHSEGYHRKALKRAHRKMTLCCEESKLAKHHEGKAAALEHMAEQRNDPAFCSRRIDEAEKLLRKLDRDLPHWQSDMDRWNKLRGEAQEKLAYWTARRDEVAPNHTADVEKASDERLAAIKAAKWGFSYVWGWQEVAKVNRHSLIMKDGTKIALKFICKWGSERP